VDPTRDKRGEIGGRKNDLVLRKINAD
jgi:hypothetical protein